MLLGKHVWYTFHVSVIGGEIFFLVNQSPSWIVQETNIAGSADMVWKVQELLREHVGRDHRGFLGTGHPKWSLEIEWTLQEKRS